MDNYELTWKGLKQNHSFVIPTGRYSLQIEKSPNGIAAHFDLPMLASSVNRDLFEIELFCNRSEEIKIFVDGKKSTMFFLGQIVAIQSPTKTIQFVFEIERGEGELIGHLSYGNRPHQKTLARFEANDWRIALRTIRRAPLLLRLQVGFV